MGTFHILSLTPDGLLNHPELLGNYLAAPHFAYKSDSGWDEAAQLDFERDLTINNISLRSQPIDVIRRRVFQEVDGTEIEEPSLLARVLMSAVGGQFCEAPLNTLLGRQVLLASKPTFIKFKSQIATGKKEQLQTMTQQAVHFLAPNMQDLNWETNLNQGAKRIILTYCFAIVTDEESGTPIVMAVRKGESQLSMIPYQDYTAWVSACKEKLDLPFEVEPLASTYATFQLVQGFTERTQPAVFMQYTNVNFMIHFPDLLIFRHVYGVNKSQPRMPRSASSGFIPPVTTYARPGIPSPEPRETADVTGFYGNNKTSFHSFSQLNLELDIAGSYYKWDILEADNALGAIETVRRSMNTSIPLIKRPIVVEAGNERGPLFLPNEAHSLQRELGQLIAEKRCLESSHFQKNSLQEKLLLKLTEMQPKIAEIEMLDGLKVFRIQTRAPDDADFSRDQFLAAYALLFYPSQNPNFTSSLGKHLNERSIRASAYAQERSQHDILAQIHIYDVAKETTTVMTKHRLYTLRGNRLLTEPCAITINKEDEQSNAFSSLLFAIQHHCAKKSSVEVIIPIIFNNGSAQKVVSTALVHFTLFKGGLLLLSENEELNEETSEPCAQSIIHLKVPAPESTGFFKHKDSTTKSNSWELELCQEINRAFNPGSPKETFKHNRMVRTYAKKHFKFTTALLDTLTQYLDRAPSQNIYSCQMVQTDVFLYLRCIGELPITEYSVLQYIGAEGISVSYHEIFKGRPTRLEFKVLNDQIIALREGIKKQKEYLLVFEDKIDLCYRSLNMVCEIMRESPEIAYPIAIAAIERNATLEMQIIEHKAQRTEMEQQIKELSRQIADLKGEQNLNTSSASSEEDYPRGPRS